MIKQIRYLSLISLLLALLLFTVPTAFAAKSAEFSLSDTKAQKDRLFEVTLTAKGSEDIAAFVAELNFDFKGVQYRSATVCDDDAECSVNITEEGKLTVAYLCEEGVNCTENTPLIIFKFKAVKAQNSEISLSVRDAIDSSSSDIPLVSCDSGSISVLRSDSEAQDNSNKLSDSNAVSTTYTDEVSKDSGSMTVFGSPGSKAVLISCGLAGVALLGAVSFCAYKFGVNMGQAKNKENIPLEKNKDTKFKD